MDLAQSREPGGRQRAVTSAGVECSTFRDNGSNNVTNSQSLAM